jgi:hypothetical protein
VGASKVPRKADWMIWEAANEALFSLRVRDSEGELEFVVDFLEKLLKLRVTNEDQWICRFNVPDIVAVVKVSESVLYV